MTPPGLEHWPESDATLAEEIQREMVRDYEC